MTEENKFSNDLEELKKYISRRFDEISMEINATSQMIDMTETSIGDKFLEVLKVLNAVGHSAGGKSGDNSGFELDTVVNQTEQATNDIMDSAEAVDNLLKNKVDFTNEEARTNWIKEIEDNVDKIMMACSFQDLTGQRINKAVNNIRDAETRLQNVLDEIGLNVSDVTSLSQDLIAPRIASQDDVDAMFEAAKKAITE